MSRLPSGTERRWLRLPTDLWEKIDAAVTALEDRDYHYVVRKILEGHFAGAAEGDIIRRPPGSSRQETRSRP